METPRRMVLGLGNTLNRDEGFGVHCLHALRTRIGDVPDLELVDGGTLGLGLVPLVEAASHLLVLDAVDAGRAPGALVELAGDEIPLFAGIKLSVHQASLQEVLGISRVRGHFPPHLHLIGVQPAELDVGLELSPAVAAALQPAVERAISRLVRWHLLPPA